MNSAIEPQVVVSPKLPLWNTICHSYSTYFYNFGDVLRISWLWLVLLVPLLGRSGWVQALWMARVVADAKRGQIQTLNAAPPIEMTVLGPIGGLVLMLAGASIAVAWHRRIILGEHPRLSGTNIATKNVWRYVGVGIAIGVIAILPPVLISLVIFLILLILRSEILMPVLILLVSATIAVVMLRLSLLLPARAVGDLRLTFKETWNRTSRNTWRIFWGILACTLLPGLAVYIALLSLVGFPTPATMTSGALVAPLVITSTFSAIYSLLIMPIWIGFLSLSYRHFFERT